MKPEDLLERAKSAIGKGIYYKLGCGGYHPQDALPARPVWRIPKGGLTPRKRPFCDCSGFISWVCGWPRAKTVVAGMWGLSTDSVHRDATRKQLYFRRIPEAVPGCLAVYPDYRKDGKTHQGHIALVTDVAARKVLDCSSSADGVSDHVQPVFWNGNHETVWCIFLGEL